MLQSYERRPWLGRAMAVVGHEDLLKSLAMPVLCMAGDNDPLQKETMKAALLCKNGKYVNLGPVGTDVVDEVPDEYVSELLAFLLPEDDIAQPDRASWSIQSQMVATGMAAMGNRPSAGNEPATRPLESQASDVGQGNKATSGPGPSNRNSNDSEGVRNSLDKKKKFMGLFKK